jgi:NAD(P)-dependent dehydrogenase (short-subunit alcohol dehydrogenase family)
MDNKVCIVTGASSGIGYGVATRLAKENAIPVLLSRDNARGKQVAEELYRINKNVEWIPTDLSSLVSIRNFVDQVKSHYTQCDVLFNCAGIQQMERQVSADGLELMFAVNYLGHFLLTNLLFDLFRAANGARVITTSGSSHKATTAEGLNVGTINFDDLQGKKQFNFARQSKQIVLAKILFTYELARRWEPYGIAACTLSPGLVKTNLVSHLPWYVRFYFDIRCRLGHAQTPEQAAGHFLDLANRPDVNGKYFEADSGILIEARSSEESYDTEIAKHLWKVSEDLVHQHFDYQNNYQRQFDANLTRTEYVTH